MSLFSELDSKDRLILELLQGDARMTNAAIAQEVGLTASSVYERIKKLEARGVIAGYRAVLNPEALGRPITAFIRVTAQSAPDAYPQYQADVRSVAADPDVLECHSVAGEDCFILKVKVGQPGDLDRLLGRIRTKLSVVRTVTMIVLDTIKEDTRLSLVDEPPAGR